jgi:hypothetical protein
MENKKMDLKARPTILLIGNDTTLNYLLGRFAERNGNQLTMNLENLSIKQIELANPAVIIFTSTELLATNRALVEGLSSLDILIMVCSSVAEEGRARELGADHCLLHPLTYHDFQTAIALASTTKRT